MNFVLISSTNNRTYLASVIVITRDVHRLAKIKSKGFIEWDVLALKGSLCTLARGNTILKYKLLDF